MAMLLGNNGNWLHEFIFKSLKQFFSFQVANTKEMKETANLLEKETEMRRPKPKLVMEGGDSKEQGTSPYLAAIGRDGEGQISPLPSEVHPKSPVKKNSNKPRRLQF